MNDMFSHIQSKRVVLVSLSLVLTVGILFEPMIVRAQMHDAPAAVQRQALDIKADITDKVLKGLIHSGMGALINGLSFLVRKVAFDTARFLGSGGKGQAALIFQDGLGEYALKAMGDTAGEAIGSIGETFGLDLCQIPDPRIMISLQLGLNKDFLGSGGGKSKCSWQDLRDSWGNIDQVLEERYGPGGSKLASELFNANLNVDESDFGVGLEAIGKIDGLQRAAEAAANLERLIGEGLKDVKGLISNNIVTPAHVLKDEIEQLDANSTVKQTAGQIAGIYGSELEALPGMALSVFVNSFASELLNTVFTGLFPEKSGSDGAGIGGFYAANVINRRKQVEQVLSFFRTSNITQISNYRILNEMASCPETPGLNNCVIDSAFQQAVERAEQGTPLTVREARELGLLHSEWPLVSPRRASDNENVKKCYQNAYCYSNLQKLRRVRILPLGFEIAALRSDPDIPWTLGDVIDGFDDCNVRGQGDAAHPYCHLIDPNWVLKIPEVRVATEVYGPQLIDPNSNTRNRERVDLETCVTRGRDGNCVAWGYCTREKNTWVLGGDVCPSYYATCTTYQNDDTRATVNYLENTVDFGQCDETSVGCRAYVSERDATGAWVRQQTSSTLKRLGREQVITFDQTVSRCDNTGDGCTALYSAERGADFQFIKRNTDGEVDYRTGTYRKNITEIVRLKMAPDYLGCYDTDTATAVRDWPVTSQQASTVSSRNSACQNYATACTVSDVGCNNYTAVNGGGVVPGVVNSSNFCNAECVGYDTFRQERSNFEGEKFPVYFIPSAGRQCDDAYAGCDAFTNIDTAASGGEGTEFFSYTMYCEKPTGSNERAYFSWEGSEREGFVLRRHRLLQIDQARASLIDSQDVEDVLGNNFVAGSPEYSDRSYASLVRQVERCDVGSYNTLINSPFDVGAAHPDCRELLDSSGTKYYRILFDTVLVSNQCLRFRKSESLLETDPDLTTAGQSACAQVGGVFVDVTPADGQTNPVCQVCYGGGRYEGGSCIYNVLPTESTSCRGPASEPARFVGCREYSGNTSGNVEDRVVFDTFERASSTQELSTIGTEWGVGTSASVRVVPESIQAGQNSLLIDVGVASRVIASGTLKNARQYELKFWARSNVPQNLVIDLAQTIGANTNSVGTFTIDVDTGFASDVSIGNVWREYHLGPIEYTGTHGVPVSLRLIRSASGGGVGTYFIDNLRLSRTEDREYLVKNSWQRRVGAELYHAPASCFAPGQSPTGTLPGVALGCDTYRDPDGNSYNLTGFASLCRAESVGCEPVYESHGTVGDSSAKLFNAWCDASSAQISGNTCTISGLSDTPGTCIIPRGERGCYIAEITLKNNIGVSEISLSAIVTSTIIVPAETDTPIYLVNRSEYRCKSDQVGCMAIGLETDSAPGSAVSYTYSTVYLKNNPAKYSTELCRDEQIGCAAYSGGTSKSYFKDPVITGASTCSYKKRARVGDIDASGWFREGVGVCSGNSAITCKTNTDCGSTGSCEAIGTSIACYPNFIGAGNTYGIWTNGSAQYEGYVGVCEAGANSCTEIFDRADQTFGTEGKAYYRLDNHTLTKDVGQCSGQVSQREGCVLFDRTDEPNKRYSTALTYKASSEVKPKYGFVDPLSGSNNDSNLILKVNRDRVCSEWLACQSYETQTDDSGRTKKLCSQFKACNASMPGVDCINFVDRSKSVGLLNQEKYTGRDVSWYGEEFSGYSLFDKYQIGDLANVSFPEETKQFLAYMVDPAVFSSQIEFISKSCNGVNKTNGSICGPFDQGRCVNNKCLYSFDGLPYQPIVRLPSDPPTFERTTSTMNDLKKVLLSASCKGFPEATSPFPKYVAKVFTNEDTKLVASALSVDILDSSGSVVRKLSRNIFPLRVKGFEQANICQNGNCSCEYEKYTYANGVSDYWNPEKLDRTKIPPGICAGGNLDGAPCEIDDNCREYKGTVRTPEFLVSSGTCNRLKSKEKNLGLFGFCLEYDLSHPINGRFERAQVSDGRTAQEYACLTWLPIQTGVSNVDIYNLDISAGYNPAEDAKNAPNDTKRGGEVMCANANSSFVYSPELITVNDGERINALMNRMRRIYFYNSSDIFMNVNDLAGRNIVVSQSNPHKIMNFYVYGLDFYSASPGTVPYIMPYFIDRVSSSQLTQTDFPVIPFDEFYLGSNSRSAATNYLTLADKDGNRCASYDWNKIKRERPNELQNGFYVKDACYMTLTHLSTEGDIGAGESAREMAKAMQVWAWRNLGENSVLLRVEGGIGRTETHKYQIDVPYTVVRGRSAPTLNSSNSVISRVGNSNDRCTPNITLNPQQQILSANGQPPGENKCVNNFISSSRIVFTPFLGSRNCHPFYPGDGGSAINYISFPGIKSCIDFESRRNLAKMHPPRSWSEGSTPVVGTYNYGDYAMMVAGEGINQHYPYDSLNTANNGQRVLNIDKIVPISPLGLSADRNIRDGYTVSRDTNLATSILPSGDLPVYRTLEEHNLREGDIDTVYFVPLIYPEGFGHEVWRFSPAIMSKGFKLSVAELNRKLSSVTDNGASLDNFSTMFVVSSRCNEVACGDDTDDDAINDKEFLNNSGDEVLNFHPNPELLRPNGLLESDDAYFRYENTGQIWNYVLQNDKPFGSTERGPGSLLSYDTYDLNPYIDGKTWNFAASAGSLLENYGNNERNYVARRYVTVFFYKNPNSNEYPEFIPINSGSPKSVYPLNAQNDPFTKNCASASTHSMAIGMDFNKGGEFLGYITKSCGEFPRFAVISTQVNKCLEFVKVYEDANVGTNLPTNKAWTQRAWAGSNEPGTTGPLRHPTYSPGSDIFTRHTPLRPFGMLDLVGSDIENNNTRIDYTFNKPEKGIPYSCSGTFIPRITPSPNCSAMARVGYDSALVSMLATKSPDNALTAIQNLFLKSFLVKKFVITGDTGAFQIVPSFDNSHSPSGGYIHNAPRIYSLNPAFCKTESTEPCIAGDADNISVNGRNGTMKNYDNDPLGIPDEDINRDGLPDAIIGVGVYSANVRFFAVADDNAMPIRRVEIDWGDDSDFQNEGINGMYQNRKPFCSNSDSKTEGNTNRVGLCRALLSSGIEGVSMLTCRRDSDCPVELMGTRGIRQSGSAAERATCLNDTSEYDSIISRGNSYLNNRFGNSDRACKETYFEYNHVYGCTQSDLKSELSSFTEFVRNLPNETSRSIVALGLNPNDKVCVFVPKVRVTDNWEWCTGTCRGSNNAGCYGDPGACSSDASSSFVPYRGSIIVIPVSTTTLFRVQSEI
jgi:hypothetical protein